MYIESQARNKEVNSNFFLFVFPHKSTMLAMWIIPPLSTSLRLLCCCPSWGHHQLQQLPNWSAYLQSYLLPSIFQPCQSDFSGTQIWLHYTLVLNSLLALCDHWKKVQIDPYSVNNLPYPGVRWGKKHKKDHDKEKAYFFWRIEIKYLQALSEL